MNMYPYICETCGGAFNRCGNKNCQNTDCKGTELCWEDEAVLLIQGTKINNYSDENVEEILSYSLECLNQIVKGTYTGYGFFEIEGCNFLFFDKHYLSTYRCKDTENYIVVTPYCASCFKNIIF
jgi:hypothetical protein